MNPDHNDDDLGDWRIRAVTRLARDVPPAFPGGPSHKAGSPVYSGTETMGTDGRPLGFTTPSTTALALSLALRGAREATQRRAALLTHEVTTWMGPGNRVRAEHVESLYDCFESAMVCVTFSFQALESFANSLIAEKVSANYVLRRKNKRLVLSASELERQASTAEKLATILPDLTGVKSPKGGQLWERFVALRRVRDATVHLKSSDQYPNRNAAGGLDSGSVLYQFMNDDLLAHLETAVLLIEHFVTSVPPRWLTMFRRRLARQRSG